MTALCLLCATLTGCEKIEFDDKSEIQAEEEEHTEQPRPQKPEHDADNNEDNNEDNSEDEVEDKEENETTNGIEDGALSDYDVEGSWGYDDEEIEDWPLITPPNSSFFTVAEALDLCQDGIYGHPFAVRGYIVGYISGSSRSSTRFGLPDKATSNFVLADTPDETDYKKCLPVYLAVKRGGLPLRSMLNLYDHPEYLKRHVEIVGNLETYFKVNGIKNIWSVKIFVPRN